MSIYRDKTGIGTSWEQLTDLEGKTAPFLLPYADAYGEARIAVQNDGSSAIDFRLRRRRRQDDPTDETPAKWWDYPTYSIQPDEGPVSMKIELTEGYEYVIEVRAQTATAAASMSASPVVGEAK